MAAVLADAGSVAITNPDVLNDELGRQAFTRGLNEAVIYDPTTGNFVRYLYDETGRLARIVDPVGRASTLSWNARSEPK